MEDLVVVVCPWSPTLTKVQPRTHASFAGIAGRVGDTGRPDYKQHNNNGSGQRRNPISSQLASAVFLP